MANITQVTLTAGVPTAGTGTVGTLDNVTGTAGAPSVPVLTVQGVASGTAQPVSLATLPALTAGAAIVGKVGIDQTTPGTTNLVALAANQSVNTAQINAVTPLMGNGVTGTGSQRVTIASDNTPFPVKIDQTTPGTTNLVALAANQSVNVAQIAGTTAATGSGVMGAGTQRVALATDSPGIITTGTAGSPSTAVLTVQGVTSMTPMTVSNTPLTNFGAGEYETVAASQTAQVLGATGATGDYLQGLLVIPATTTPGLVTILDNATSIPVFVGGASSVSNLVPFFIPLGMISVSGAWKVTTGANVSVIGIGNFT